MHNSVIPPSHAHCGERHEEQVQVTVTPGARRVLLEALKLDPIVLRKRPGATLADVMGVSKVLTCRYLKGLNEAGVLYRYGRGYAFTPMEHGSVIHDHKLGRPCSGNCRAVLINRGTVEEETDMAEGIDPAIFQRIRKVMGIYPEDRRGNRTPRDKDPGGRTLDKDLTEKFMKRARLDDALYELSARDRAKLTEARKALQRHRILPKHWVAYIASVFEWAEHKRINRVTPRYLTYEGLIEIFAERLPVVTIDWWAAERMANEFIGYEASGGGLRNTIVRLRRGMEPLTGMREDVIRGARYVVEHINELPLVEVETLR